MSVFSVFSRVIAIAAGLLLLAGASRAAEPADQVWPLLAAQQQAAGDFAQELYSEDGELLERSSGRYAVLRPRFFRWEIEDPDRQQIIVAGDTLWHYDIDLAVASRRDTGGEPQFTPLELLGGDIDALRSRFVVEVLEEQRYRLQPTFSGAGFAAVEISWEQGEIVAMDIRDRGGQEIRLALTPDTSGVALAPEDFSFVPPDDVEIHLQEPLQP